MSESEVPATFQIEATLLRTLRERVSLTRARAAEVLSAIAEGDGVTAIPASSIEHWEHTSPRLTVHELEMLARTYLVPFSTILTGRLPRIAHQDFRRGPNGPVVLPYGLHSSLAEFSRLYALAKDLNGLLGVSEDVNLPSVTLPRSTDATDEVESVALKIRDSLAVTDTEQESWANDDEALAGWILAAEASGVFVFRLSMDVGVVRGLSRWDSGGPPAILLNRSDSPAAQAFTLAHELGHLATRHSTTDVTICDPSRQGTVAEERIVNRVAGATLLPQTLLSRILPSEPMPASYRDWPLALRVRIKRATHASQGAIGLRLYHLGIVSDPGLASSFWRQPTSSGWAHDTQVEKLKKTAGARTLRLAGDAIIRELVSSVDIARRLDVGFGVVEAAVSQ